MMLRHLLIGSAACLLACAAASAADTDAYAYAWPLQTSGGAAAWQVELTPAVYAASTAIDLHDVAVVDATGAAVPAARYRPPLVPSSAENLVEVPAFALPAASSATQGAADDALHLLIERGNDGRLRRIDANVGANRSAPAAATIAPAAARNDLLLDASAVHDALTALKVDWTGGADASAQFAVDASDDLQQWRSLVARGSVLHLTQDGNVLEHHDIALNHAHAAYLRVRRLDDGAALPQLTLRLRTSAPSSPARAARQWLTATPTAADADAGDTTPGAAPAASVYYYALPAALAIESLKLELADANSLARVRVSSRRSAAADARWQVRAEFVAFRLQQDGNVSGNDPVAINPAAAREWRIEAATPLSHAPALSVAYVPDRLAFLAEGSAPYRLVAGSSRARRGDYPVEAALATLRAGAGRDWQPPLATLGARVTLQGDAALTPVAVARDWKTRLLWTVLVAAAALIGGLALSLLRERKPAEPPPER
jgi:hypothetical protein